MAYFMGVCGSNEYDTQHLIDTINSFIPDNPKRGRKEFTGNKQQLIWFPTSSVIQEMFSLDNSDTWLAVFGTPLFKTHDLTKPNTTMYAFFKNPKSFLNTEIDGNFAIVGYNAEKKELYLCSDINNSVPIFFLERGNNIFFASHELSLAKLFSSNPSKLGVAQSIYLGSTWENCTRFEKIEKTRPAEILLFQKDKRHSSENYWSPEGEERWSEDLDGTIEKWGSLLENIILSYHQAGSNGSVIADLTAGEDARIIVAQCHAMGIPFKAHVTGRENETDVKIAQGAAEHCGFDLQIRSKHEVTSEMLSEKMAEIVLVNDGYQELFKACSEYATQYLSPIDDFGNIKLGGLPGGEAFRGSYYLRGKTIFPSLHGKLDLNFFTKMKFLLDYIPLLIEAKSGTFFHNTVKLVGKAINQVSLFPRGTQIDHLLRLFQTCNIGQIYKNPLYLPFASREMTKSIYWLNPRFKKRGLMTRSYTELLFPCLANRRTQNNIPTIRKTLFRLPLFLPEYYSDFRKITNGLTSRLMKWKKSNKWYYNTDINNHVIQFLINNPPYSDWFKNPNNMFSAYLYNEKLLSDIFTSAVNGRCKNSAVLGRILNLEIALRAIQ